MASKAAIDDFLAQKSLALCGVSRSGKGFGNLVRKQLQAAGYELLLVHPEAESIEGQPCVRQLRDVAGKVGGVVLVTPPEVTAKLVREVAEAGIRRVWMQQGAESEDAVRFCEAAGLTAIHGQCILMFAQPVRGIHRLHRWVRGVFGRLPS